MDDREVGAQAPSLRSLAPSDRARHAAWLLQNPRDVTTRELMEALQHESVPRLRILLLEVLEARQHETTSAALDRDVSPDAVASAALLPELDIAALIRHELSPAVGWVRLAADGEIENFHGSSTDKAVRKLQRRVDGLVALIKSSTALNLRDVELPAVFLDYWPDAATVPRIEVSSDIGSIEVQTDEGLFSLLMTNVFQNAIDAAAEVSERGEVTVVWGCTDHNYWVRVSNPFDGDRLALSDVLQVGNSSKPAHQGQGLALIQMAAQRLGIAINLEGQSGTAAFTLSGARRRA
ncbi:MULTISPECIES: ATP-binding protein [unclassified Nocardioides]|uniref:ATP-binding protein n=1 Tax=unclassified Nocardioides TaxID=2615069 RepID=UPI00138F6A57|nr:MULTISPECIES: ATP-binding protein [unclassified Nocardioides]